MAWDSKQQPLRLRNLVLQLMTRPISGERQHRAARPEQCSVKCYLVYLLCWCCLTDHQMWWKSLCSMYFKNFIYLSSFLFPLFHIEYIHETARLWRFSLVTFYSWEHRDCWLVAGGSHVASRTCEEAGAEFSIRLCRADLVRLLLSQTGPARAQPSGKYLFLAIGRTGV